MSKEELPPAASGALRITASGHFATAAEPTPHLPGHPHALLLMAPDSAYGRAQAILGARGWLERYEEALGRTQRYLPGHILRSGIFSSIVQTEIDTLSNPRKTGHKQPIPTKALTYALWQALRGTLEAAGYHQPGKGKHCDKGRTCYRCSYLVQEHVHQLPEHLRDRITTLAREHILPLIPADE